MWSPDRIKTLSHGINNPLSDDKASLVFAIKLMLHYHGQTTNLAHLSVSSVFTVAGGAVVGSPLRKQSRYYSKPRVNFNLSGKAADAVVKIGTIEDDVMMFSAKVGDETIEGITNFTIREGRLYLTQLHLQGSSAGNIGRPALWKIGKELGRQFNVKEVIIQGGKRTTGKYKGKVPSPVVIKVD